MDQYALERSENEAVNSDSRAHLYQLIKPSKDSDFALIEILLGRTGTSSSGFPYISEAAFGLFLERVPHLFEDGRALLGQLRLIEKESLQWKNVDDARMRDLLRSIKVIRNIVLTAGVTASPDCWLLRYVIHACDKLGISNLLLGQAELSTGILQKEFGFSKNTALALLHFLHARLLLEEIKSGHYIIQNRNTWKLGQIDDEFLVDAQQRISDSLVKLDELDEQDEWLDHWCKKDLNKGSRSDIAWSPQASDLEIGFRIVPLVLAWSQRWDTLPGKSEVFETKGSFKLESIKQLFSRAGFLDDSKWTSLGCRVMERGPGPFGIIATYFPYMHILPDFLTAQGKHAWVSRGENVVASLKANRKSFRHGNDRLDNFCKKHQWNYQVFIEHAVGQGEAIRQRYLRDGEDIQYYGADLEDAAIEKAEERKSAGLLPANLDFIRSADIGKPEVVLEHLKKRGDADKAKVMMVGNGFHEIRDQSDEKMIQVFRDYANAGIVLLFTEESALDDSDLIRTGWNTYHAGFRFVHELSGQGLRPAKGSSQHSGRLGWSECAEEGGYLIIDEYSYRSRTIYPNPQPGRYNPAISVTYFCLPKAVALELGIS